MAYCHRCICPPRAPAKADHETYRQWLRDYFSAVPWSLSVDAGTALARRRIIFTDQFPFLGESKDHHLELHDDGTGFAAIAVTRTQKPDSLLGDAPSQWTFLGCDTSLLEFWTLAFVDMLARHAVNTGGGGDLSIRTQLVGHPGATGITPWVLTEPFITSPPGQVQLGQRLVPGSRPLRQPLKPLDRTVPITVGTTPSDLVATAAAITHEVSADFGATPTSAQLRTDGHVNPGEPQLPRSEMLRYWARDHGVLDRDEHTE